MWGSCFHWPNATERIRKEVGLRFFGKYIQESLNNGSNEETYQTWQHTCLWHWFDLFPCYRSSRIQRYQYEGYTTVRIISNAYIIVPWWINVHTFKRVFPEESSTIWILWMDRCPCRCSFHWWLCCDVGDTLAHHWNCGWLCKQLYASCPFLHEYQWCVSDIWPIPELKHQRTNKGKGLTAQHHVLIETTQLPSPKVILTLIKKQQHWFVHTS